jgi:hypothetical protein
VQRQRKNLKKKSQRSFRLCLNCMPPTNSFTPPTEVNTFRLGLGAPIPQVGGKNPCRTSHQSSHPEDKLRKRLLGKRATNIRPDNSRRLDPRSDGAVTTKPKLHGTKTGSESEDELGRTLFTAKAARPSRIDADLKGLHIPLTATAAAAGGDSSGLDQTTALTAPASKKRPSSYLDEVLLARSEKRKKKMKITHSQS